MKPRSSEERIQGMVHSLEAGALGRLMRLLLVLTAMVALALVLLFVKFKGLSAAEGMDQAQIAREYARGNGLVSQQIRPFEMFLEVEKGRPEVSKPLQDTFHAPLWPLTLGTVFKFAKPETWNFSRNSMVYPGDRVVAIVGIIFLALAFAAAWFLTYQVFDKTVAWITLGMLVLCPLFWEYALSGLSHPMVMLWSLLALNTLFRAVHLQASEELGAWKWLLATAVFLALATLANGLLAWLTLGVLIYSAFYFSGKRLLVLAMLGIYLLLIAPWLVRNQTIFGTPFGLGGYQIFDGVLGSTNDLFSNYHPELGRLPLGRLLRKGVDNFVAQLVAVIPLNAGLLIVPLFFASLLHAWKRSDTSSFRWLLCLAWLSLLFGSSLFGASTDPLAPAQLQIVLTPILVAYSTAFLLVLTTRFHTYAKLIRIALFIVLYGLASVPMLKLIFLDSARVNYPPYLPAAISIMGELTKPDEIISSDISWATAWYADRRSLQMPKSPQEFTEISDYRRLGGPVVGLLITPYSANSPMLTDILNGRWKPWAAFINRTNPDLRTFPCPIPITLPPDNQYLGLFDTKRWGE